MKPFSILCCTFLVGCASPGAFRKPSSQLDRAIRFTEVSAKGSSVPLSGVGSDVTRVPNGTAIDVNSSILIELDKEAIQILGGEVPPDQAYLARLSQRRKRLSEALAVLADTVDARLDALDAYAATRLIPFEDLQTSTAFVAFSSAVAKSGSLKTKFSELDLWIDGTFTEDEVDDAFFDKTLAKVGVLLRRELNSAEAELQKTVDRANRNAGTITMQAFLEPTGNGEQTPIHLEGYDLFDRKSVALKSSSVMDGDDWKAFERQYEQVVDLARQAERVRAGEVALDQALMQNGSEALQRVIESTTEIRPLFEKDWRKLLSGLESDFARVRRFTEETLKRHSESEVTLWKEQAEAVAASALQELPIADAKALRDELANLRLDWRRVAPDSMVSLLKRTRGLQDKAKSLSERFSRADVEPAIRTFGRAIQSLEQRPANISDAVWAEIHQEVEKIPSLVEARQIYQSLVSLVALAKGIPAMLKFAEIEPSQTRVQSPQVVDVPIVQAKDTAIELQRTSRVLNDKITYLATLKSGPTTLMETRASFQVREFGWHSVLAPSVILSRQWFARSSREHDFKFSPAVAWLRKYLPRDTETGKSNALARLLQPGIGLHAAFLDHSQGNDTEVGLGGAFSFWNDLFVAGVGANLMNNSRVYFYVGSNLIPILQRLGYAKEGGAGKRP
jgi:hypothetical protein